MTTAEASLAVPSGRGATNAGLRRIVRRIAISLATLLVIAFLTQWGMIMYGRVVEGLAAQPAQSAVDAIGATRDYLLNHPSSYTWQKQDVPWYTVVLRLFGHSAVLLMAALGIAVVIGIPLGIFAALRRPAGSSWIALTAIIGMSIPSFLLGMILWVINIQVHRTFAISVLPATGYGLDWHLVMPALVLATRPLAQITSVTNLTTRSILGEDYVRTARAKGLKPRVLLWRHVLRNGLIPILTAIVTSLRYALASLPVVEYFFVWLGVGLALLTAVRAGASTLATDLTVALGLFFLVLTSLLDWLYPFIDPRLQDDLRRAEVAEHRGFTDGLRNAGRNFEAALAGLVRRIRRPQRAPLPPLPQASFAGGASESPDAQPPRRGWRAALRAVNLPLVVGTLGLLALLVLALFGGSWIRTSPYETNDLLTIEGVMGSPPFGISSVFPWGSDMLGRDLQALLLAGARQTLFMAALAVAARITLGATLGMAAGWWKGSFFDRLVTATWTVWAAFPVTLFAMIVILALGIQQGMGVFVVALCIVGWGEIAQLVRAQTIRIRAEPYMEGAEVVGASQLRQLTRHALPNLADSLIVLTVLEMGAVMLLLAELGFLNIFVGGGYRAMIGEVGSMQPIIVHVSDVPEWSALLANTRDWWRSYPWMGWYPGVLFFLAILTFNLWGEGLRRFLAASRISIIRLLNRVVVAGGLAVVVGMFWFIRTSSPSSQYLGEARKFDAEGAYAHVSALSEFYQGRESGTGGAAAAAMYIADEMGLIGLTPAGSGKDYYQLITTKRPHLTEVPRLELLGPDGGLLQSFLYRQDFVEMVQSFPTIGTAEGPVVGMAVGPDPELPSSRDPYGLQRMGLGDVMVLMREEALERTPVAGVAGALIVTSDPMTFERKYLFPQLSAYFVNYSGYVTYGEGAPSVFISEALAEQILGSVGSSLAELDAMEDGLAPGQVAMTEAGPPFRLSVQAPTVDDLSEKYVTVMGYIPGQGAKMESGGPRGMDSQVILVSAYYDGLGIGPDGTKYSGANDNASGVATMLEIARVLQESPVKPLKTVVFVAWPGGDRWESLSVPQVMGAAKGFNTLEVEAVLEISGVGAGSGDQLALGEGTSFRLVRLFEEIGRKVGVGVTNTGRTTHFGLPVIPPVGGREAASAYLSWDGADAGAHLASDTIAAIDPAKLRLAGETTLLSVFVLSREAEW
jgi:ABC-type dipeptide/oligopeptide/nickel transport system permease subunit